VDAEPVTEIVPYDEAAAGDVLVIHGHRLGEPERLGEILAVLGSPGHVHFRVRWDDGHESLFYPGSDASVRRAAKLPPNRRHAGRSVTRAPRAS
jgi:hypothetical protein